MKLFLLNLHVSNLNQISVLDFLRQLPMTQNVISQIIFAPDGESTAFDETIDFDLRVRDCDVPAKMVGREESFLALITLLVEGKERKIEKSRRFEVEKRFFKRNV